MTKSIYKLTTKSQQPNRKISQKYEGIVQRRADAEGQQIRHSNSNDDISPFKLAKFKSSETFFAVRGKEYSYF